MLRRPASRHCYVFSLHSIESVNLSWMRLTRTLESHSDSPLSTNFCFSACCFYSPSVRSWQRSTGELARVKSGGGKDLPDQTSDGATEVLPL